MNIDEEYAGSNDIEGDSQGERDQTYVIKQELAEFQEEIKGFYEALLVKFDTYDIRHMRGAHTTEEELPIETTETIHDKGLIETPAVEREGRPEAESKKRRAILPKLAIAAVVALIIIGIILILGAVGVNIGSFTAWIWAGIIVGAVTVGIGLGHIIYKTCW